MRGIDNCCGDGSTSTFSLAGRLFLAARLFTASFRLNTRTACRYSNPARRSRIHARRHAAVILGSGKLSCTGGRFFMTRARRPSTILRLAARGRSVRGRKWGTAIRFSLVEPHCFQHKCDARIGGCPLFRVVGLAPRAVNLGSLSLTTEIPARLPLRLGKGHSSQIESPHPLKSSRAQVADLPAAGRKCRDNGRGSDSSN